MSGRDRRARQQQMNAAEAALLSRLHPSIHVDLIVTNCARHTLRHIVAEIDHSSIDALHDSLTRCVENQQAKIPAKLKSELHSIVQSIKTNVTLYCGNKVTNSITALYSVTDDFCAPIF